MLVCGQVVLICPNDRVRNMLADSKFHLSFKPQVSYTFLDPCQSRSSQLFNIFLVAALILFRISGPFFRLFYPLRTSPMVILNYLMFLCTVSGFRCNIDYFCYSLFKMFFWRCFALNWGRGHVERNYIRFSVIFYC